MTKPEHAFVKLTETDLVAIIEAIGALDSIAEREDTALPEEAYNVQAKVMLCLDAFRKKDRGIDFHRFQEAFDFLGEAEEALIQVEDEEDIDKVKDACQESYGHIEDAWRQIAYLKNELERPFNPED